MTNQAVAHCNYDNNDKPTKLPGADELTVLKARAKLLVTCACGWIQYSKAQYRKALDGECL